MSFRCQATCPGLEASSMFSTMAKHLNCLHVLLDADIYASHAIVYVHAHSNIYVCAVSNH